MFVYRLLAFKKHKFRRHKNCWKCLLIEVWIGETRHMLSNAIIIRKTVVLLRLKSPVCSSWKFVAASFAFFVQNFFKINFKNFTSKNIFRTACCGVKFLTFFETTSFYIFFARSPAITTSNSCDRHQLWHDSLCCTLIGWKNYSRCWLVEHKLKFFKGNHLTTAWGDLKLIICKTLCLCRAASMQPCVSYDRNCPAQHTSVTPTPTQSVTFALKNIKRGIYIKYKAAKVLKTTSYLSRQCNLPNYYLLRNLSVSWIFRNFSKCFPRFFKQLYYIYKIEFVMKACLFL
jgi:hypothetical protein